MLIELKDVALLLAQPSALNLLHHPTYVPYVNMALVFDDSSSVRKALRNIVILHKNLVFPVSKQHVILLIS